MQELGIMWVFGKISQEEYDTENLTEKSNYTETTQKALQKVIAVSFSIYHTESYW